MVNELRISDYSCVPTWQNPSMRIFVLSALLGKVPFVPSWLSKMTNLFLVQSLSRYQEAIRFSSRWISFVMSLLFLCSVLKLLLPCFFVNVVCFLVTFVCLVLFFRIPIVWLVLLVFYRIIVCHCNICVFYFK